MGGGEERAEEDGGGEEPLSSALIIVTLALATVSVQHPNESNTPALWEL